MNATTIRFERLQCHCGCGKSVGKKANFAQGHDARFVSAMVTLAQANPTTGPKTEVSIQDASGDGPAQISQVSIEEAVRRLGSDKLAEKFVKSFDRANGRAEDKAATAAKKAIDRENAKGRRTSAAKTTGPGVTIEPPNVDNGSAPVDLDDLTSMVPGEKPVKFQKVTRGRGNATPAKSEG